MPLARKRMLAPMHAGQGHVILLKENKAPIAMLILPGDCLFLLIFSRLSPIVNNYVRKIY